MCFFLDWKVVNWRESSWQIKITFTKKLFCLNSTMLSFFQFGLSAFENC